jgi:hypothetical protein
MITAIKFFKKTFENEKAKEAYAELNAWLADNVIKKEVEIGEVFWKVNRIKKADLPTFELELYATIDEDQFVDGMCQRCQEFHKLFYISDQFNCDACKMKAWRNGLDQKLSIKKQYRKEQLKRILYEE